MELTFEIIPTQARGDVAAILRKLAIMPQRGAGHSQIEPENQNRIRGKATFVAAFPNSPILWPTKSWSTML